MNQVEGRAIPAFSLWRLMIRQPRNVVAAARVAADCRQVAVRGAKRIIDHRVKDLAPDPRFFAEHAIPLLESVRHLGVVGVRNRTVREGEFREL